MIAINTDYIPRARSAFPKNPEYTCKTRGDAARVPHDGGALAVSTKHSGIAYHVAFSIVPHPKTRLVGLNGWKSQKWKCPRTSNVIHFNNQKLNVECVTMGSSQWKTNIVLATVENRCYDVWFTWFTNHRNTAANPMTKLAKYFKIMLRDERDNRNRHVHRNYWVPKRMAGISENTHVRSALPQMVCVKRRDTTIFYSSSSIRWCHRIQPFLFFFVSFRKSQCNPLYSNFIYAPRISIPKSVSNVACRWRWRAEHDYPKWIIHWMWIINNRYQLNFKSI